MRLKIMAILSLIVLFFGVQSQTTQMDPLYEDIDKDGIPTVVEEQVGTDPYDPLSCIYVEGVSDIGLEGMIIEIEVGANKINVSSG